MNEAEKYELLYDQVPEYRDGSPGVGHLKRFKHYLSPRATINIYGCGPGRAGRILAQRGHEVRMIDIARNALEDSTIEYMMDADRLSFIAGDLGTMLGVMPPADFGYCCDVMEHIPTDRVERVLQNIKYLTPNTYFAIAGQPDGYGARIGQTLHMTVKPFEWWQERLWKSQTVSQSPSVFVFMCEGE